jgi:pyruvate dehydrogenase E1 component alpha subunit
MALFFRRQAFSGASRVVQRGFASANDPGSVRIDLGGCFESHNFDDVPTEAYTTKEELIRYFTTMYTGRRMEIMCDTNYKSKAIRGFCHLYDGQEACATGVNEALSSDDCWVTSYRCHYLALIRGGTVEGVLSELFGYHEGQTKGKGGSMHFYNKPHNFYGGQGIVGAQVPVGAGLAFACKYNAKSDTEMNIAVAGFGDGAANQGQIWEAANMASLWKLPFVLMCENNHYGMGTASGRSSSNNSYFTMGNYIPGMRMDGNNIFAVREGMSRVKNYSGSGNGPVYVELDTYRYHGHSMSDPGTAYRTRDEVSAARESRDPIDFTKKLLLEHSFVTEKELKELDKEIKKKVDAAAKKAHKGSIPPATELYADIFTNGSGGPEMPPYVRMPDNMQSIGAHPFV